MARHAQAQRPAILPAELPSLRFTVLYCTLTLPSLLTALYVPSHSNQSCPCSSTALANELKAGIRAACTITYICSNMGK